MFDASVALFPCNPFSTLVDPDYARNLHPSFTQRFPRVQLWVQRVALLSLQLLFQVLRTRLSRSLVSVQSILLVHGIGKYHGSGFLVNHLYARGVIRMNLTKDQHLHRSWLLFLRRTCNHVGCSRLVGYDGQGNFLFLESSREIGFKAVD